MAILVDDYPFLTTEYAISGETFNGVLPIGTEVEIIESNDEESVVEVHDVLTHLPQYKEDKLYITVPNTDISF